jgi:hypothetical protein
MRTDEIKSVNALIDKVSDVISDFTMPYDDSEDTEHTKDSMAYKYACALDELNAFVSDLVDKTN